MCQNSIRFMKFINIDKPYIYPSGDYFVGDWKEGSKNGNGEYHSSDGQVYKGEWKDDMRNGQGTNIHSDGTKEVGTWKNDKFLSKTKS